MTWIQQLGVPWQKGHCMILDCGSWYADTLKLPCCWQWLSQTTQKTTYIRCGTSFAKSRGRGSTRQDLQHIYNCKMQWVVFLLISIESGIAKPHVHNTNQPMVLGTVEYLVMLLTSSSTSHIFASTATSQKKINKNCHHIDLASCPTAACSVLAPR